MCLLPGKSGISCFISFCSFSGMLGHLKYSSWFALGKRPGSQGICIGHRSFSWLHVTSLTFSFSPQFLTPFHCLAMSPFCMLLALADEREHSTETDTCAGGRLATAQALFPGSQLALGAHLLETQGCFEHIRLTGCAHCWERVRTPGMTSPGPVVPPQTAALQVRGGG